MYPCTLFALHREARPFLSRFSRRERLVSAPCPAWLCGESLGRVIVLETGVGPRRRARAFDWLLDCWLSERGLLQPLCVLSAGFAGALADGWKVGDVLVASEVVGTRGEAWSCDVVPPGLPTGRLLFSRELIGDAAEKQRLGVVHGAAAVDMESGVVARMCTERGIPFGCVQAISDDVDTSLSPCLLRLLADSRVSIPRLACALLRGPRLLGELLRLRRATAGAARRLGEVLCHVLELHGELPTLSVPKARE